MSKADFEYEGYVIPVELIDLTGGGTETWDAISKGHVDELNKYCPISPNATVLEPGCGVGRDAIQLTRLLSDKGRYIGFDIIKSSIEWCKNNITPRHPNFTFFHLDINSQIHNPAGRKQSTQFKLPAENGSVDRVILHSVFTHMFEDDIKHYLKEFRRVLKPDGKVMASFFIVDNETLERALKQSGDLTFKFSYGRGCYINDERHPEGAVGYTPEGFDRMLKSSGLRLDQPLHRGSWSGLTDVSDGQDIAILKVDPQAGQRAKLGRLFSQLTRGTAAPTR